MSAIKKALRRIQKAKGTGLRVGCKGGEIVSLPDFFVSTFEQMIFLCEPSEQEHWDALYKLGVREAMYIGNEAPPVVNIQIHQHSSELSRERCLQFVNQCEVNYNQFHPTQAFSITLSKCSPQKRVILFSAIGNMEIKKSF